MAGKEGKTKIVVRDADQPEEADFRHKHVVTWLDTYSEPMPGKGNWSNQTNANICRLLQFAGEPVAFIQLTGPDTCRTLFCDMIPLEVVVRGEIDRTSSYLKRNPGVVVGKRLDVPIVEFFLKTDDASWKGKPLPDVDPFITHFDETGIWVHHPKQPVTSEGEVFLSAEELGWEPDGMWLFAEMKRLSLRSFKTVRVFFDLSGLNLKDWKEEYGFDVWRRLLHADVYDNDMWRLEDAAGREYSKQVIRNRGIEGIEDSKLDYAYIAQVTGEMVERSLK